MHCYEDVEDDIGKYLYRAGEIKQGIIRNALAN